MISTNAAAALIALVIVLAAGSFRKVAECKDSSQEVVMVLYQWFEKGTPTGRFKLEGDRTKPIIFHDPNFSVGGKTIKDNFQMTCSFYLRKKDVKEKR